MIPCTLCTYICMYSICEHLLQVDAEIMDVRLALHKAFAEEQRQSVS